jgi:hypothetical protein
MENNLEIAVTDLDLSEEIINQKAEEEAVFSAYERNLNIGW